MSQDFKGSTCLRKVKFEIVPKLFLPNLTVDLSQKEIVKKSYFNGHICCLMRVIPMHAIERLEQNF